MKQAEDGLRAIDKTKLPGKYTIWCLQFGLHPRLSWPLMMCKLAVTRVDQIQMNCNVYTKKRLGLQMMLNENSTVQTMWSPAVTAKIYHRSLQSSKYQDSDDAEIRDDPPVVREVVTSRG